MHRRQHEAERAAQLEAGRQAYVEGLIGVIGGKPAEHGSPLVLKPGERVLLFLHGAGLFEPRSSGGHWDGRSAGFSIPVPDTRLRFRVGKTRGTFVRAPEEPTVIDTGDATVTDQRCVFQGARQVREWDWPKLLGITHDPSRAATALQVSNRQKVSGITYKGADPSQLHLAFEVAVALGEGHDQDVLAELRGMLPALPAETAPEPAPTASPLPPPSSPAGWYADPRGHHEVRYWTGKVWSEHVADGGVQAVDPPS